MMKRLTYLQVMMKRSLTYLQVMMKRLPFRTFGLLFLLVICGFNYRTLHNYSVKPVMAYECPFTPRTAEPTPRPAISPIQSMLARFGITKSVTKPPGGAHGGWVYDREVIRTEHVGFDRGFAQSIVKYVTNNTPGKGGLGQPPVTLGDIGAGVGQLGAWLTDHKVTNVSWFGWDGGTNVEALAGTVVQLRDVPHFQVPRLCYLDAAEEAEVARMGGAPYDWAVSVEVGEHIPKDRADTFIDNLVKLGRLGVVVTWAVPGQGGAWHVNEMDNEGVVTEMRGRGLRYEEEQTMAMRGDVTDLGWLKNTIMVFRRM